MTMLPLTKWYEVVIGLLLLLLLLFLSPVMIVVWPFTWVVGGLRRRRLAKKLN